jgi:exodeoxyribonuclease VII small subunit
MTAAVNLEEKSFEELLKMLEETVNQLDGSELTLEQSLATYEKSVAIAATCEQILNEAELRISQIDARKPTVIAESLDEEDEYAL